ncbi:hypothetical protein KC19_11G074600 [Ceratodon purpureus]|uniref:Uncharacterized protein n=1 Tax=Ceratodon purpureus TaxID=3225 RepID=A0A8T0GHU4_CERPU|nr:hypothetical protein KC19_11G074600 [Ceratodon purpureus]
MTMVVQERNMGRGYRAGSWQCRELASGLTGLVALRCGFLQSMCREDPLEVEQCSFR